MSSVPDNEPWYLSSVVSKMMRLIIEKHFPYKLHLLLLHIKKWFRRAITFYVQLSRKNNYSIYIAWFFFEMRPIHDSNVQKKNNHFLSSVTLWWIKTLLDRFKKYKRLLKKIISVKWTWQNIRTCFDIVY